MEDKQDEDSGKEGAKKGSKSGGSSPGTSEGKGGHGSQVNELVLIFTTPLYVFISVRYLSQGDSLVNLFCRLSLGSEH